MNGLDANTGDETSAAVKMPANRVIVHFDKDGELNYFVEAGSGIDLYIVDERVPHDRVYKWSGKDPSEVIDGLMGTDEIGHSGDAKHAGVAARINELLTGKPRLSLVPAEGTEAAEGED